MALNKNCEGCKAYVGIGHGEVCQDYNKNNSCPCESCIVKMMCVSACDTCRVWAKNIRGRIDEK